jgi:uncharacterized DUF497 family protein
VPGHQDDEFERAVEKIDDRMRRSGFDFHAATRIFRSDRFVERWDEVHSAPGEDHIVATGMLGTVFVSIVYVQRGTRKRIVGAFESDEGDIKDYLVTYAIEE